MIETVVAIIGAGPLGIELAIALKKLKIPFKVFDKAQAGQMIYNFPPQTHFFSSSELISIAGIPIQTIDQQKCTREYYLAYLRSLIMHFELELNTFEEVIEIKKITPERFHIKTNSKAGQQEYFSRFVVFATGSTSKPRKLNIPGEEFRHVLVKMGDPHLYFQKEVVIIGGRNSAVETALRCYHAGAKSTIVYRGLSFDPESIKYWLYPELKGLLRKKLISCFVETEVLEILKSSVKIKIRRKQQYLSEIDSLPKDQSEVIKEIPANFVIKTIGFDSDVSLCHQLGINIDSGNVPEYNLETMETNICGAFLLGTIVGGTQKKYKVFIENTHVHIDKIMNTICNRLQIKFNHQLQFHVGVSNENSEHPLEE